MAVIGVVVGTNAFTAEMMAKIEMTSIPERILFGMILRLRLILRLLVEGILELQRILNEILSMKLYNDTAREGWV